jgi:DNA repair exonuclease SbcCD ATPase subunit
MKLFLSNFKCWKNITFTFPDAGKVLISGRSGIGKTSIFQALLFVLFGKGNKIYPLNLPNVKTEVILEYKNLVIKRTRKPNYLSVNKDSNLYEDKVAQEIINTSFNQYFEVFSYIGQKGINSFLNLSSSEKLSLLESLIFSNIDIDNLKDVIKEKISVIESENSNLSGKYQTLKDFYLAQKKKVIDYANEIKDNPFFKKRESVIKVKTEFYNKRIHLLTTEIKNNHKEIELLHHKKTQYMLFDQKIIKLQEQLIGKKNELDELNLINLDNKESNLKQLEDRLLYLHKVLKCQELKEKFNSIYSKEIEHLDAEISNYKEPLWNKQSESESVKMVELHITYNNLHEKIEKYLSLCKDDYTAEIKNIENTIFSKEKFLSEYLDYVKVRQCPGCGVCLRVYDGDLKLVDTEISFDKFKNVSAVKIRNEARALKKVLDSRVKVQKTIDKNIVILKELITEKESIKLPAMSLSELESYIVTNKKLSNLLELKEDLVSGKYKFYSNLALLHTDIQVLNTKDDKVDINEVSDLNKKIEDIKVLERQNELNLRNRSRIEKDIISINDQLKMCTKDEDYDSVQEIEYAIEDYKLMIEENQQKIQEYKIALEQLSKQEHLILMKKEYVEIKEKYDRTKEQRNILINDITALHTLKRLVIESESIALTNILETINNTLFKYLNIFFIDQTISVKLQSFITTLKGITKPQINVQITHNNNDVDLKNLSGGEFDRIQLAFILTFSEIFNIPFILLDESISSLDETTTEQVMSCFNMIKDKLILVIAHQQVSGIFDEVINL